MRQRERQQYQIAGAIYTLIACVLTAFFGVCAVAIAQSHIAIAPAIVPAMGLLGMMALGAIWAACYAFSQVK